MGQAPSYQSLIEKMLRKLVYNQVEVSSQLSFPLLRLTLTFIKLTKTKQTKKNQANTNNKTNKNKETLASTRTNATCLLLVREAPGTLARPSTEVTQLLRLYHLLLPEQWVCSCLPSTRLQRGKLDSSYFRSFQDFFPLDHS